jgi:pimeloyl-ACP methyl ester carboxylesterase
MVLPLLMLAAACGEGHGAPTTPASAPAVIPPWEALPECSDAPGLRCLVLELPRHHEAPERGSLRVSFAVHPAERQRTGTLLVIGGGPGDDVISGISRWLPDIDVRIKERFDLITFDLRGAFRSGGLDCVAASSAWRQVPWSARSPASLQAMVDAARRFATDCPKEMGLEPDELAAYDTRQAASDLEALRRQLGIERWTVYAYSYGTQLAQVYAWSHPATIERLVLDGTVDLTVGAFDYDLQLSRAQDEVLSALLEGCRQRPDCAAGFKTSPARAYDRVVAALDGHAGGQQTAPTVSPSDWEAAVSSSLSGPRARRELLDTLAAFDALDDIGVVEAFVHREDTDAAAASSTSAGADAAASSSTSAGADAAASSSTSAGADAAAASSTSAGVYAAFICNDYGRQGTSVAARAKALALQVARAEAAGRRLRGAAYADLPCLFWESAPGGRPQPQPRPLPAPVLMVAATMDTAVPYSQSPRVAAQVGGAALLTVEGGHHIMFGNGEACVDTPVVDFIVSGMLPAESKRRCASTDF